MGGWEKIGETPALPFSVCGVRIDKVSAANTERGRNFATEEIYVITFEISRFQRSLRF